MKNKVYEYYNDTYGARVYLITGSRAFCKKWLKENLSIVNELDDAIDTKSNAGVTMEIHDQDHIKVCDVIFMNEFNNDAKTLSTLFHEIFHVAVDILLPRNIPVEYHSNEPMAYLLSAMSQFFIEKTNILKYKTKGKRK
jgi:hypothetical protein